MELREYERQCRLEANRQWAYPDLVDDHEERVRQAWALREQPRKFIQWLGEKYDLTPADRW